MSPAVDAVERVLRDVPELADMSPFDRRELIARLMEAMMTDHDCWDVVEP